MPTQAPVQRSGPAREDAELAVLDPAVVRAQLLASGLWTALRTRTYSLLPAADATPRSIFVTAIDTHPLAADVQLIIAAHADDFRRGILALSRLARVLVAVPVTGDAPSPAAEAAAGLANVHCAAFAGPHPAGLPGTHIHYLIRQALRVRSGICITRAALPLAACSPVVARGANESSRWPDQESCHHGCCAPCPAPICWR